jgi:hypothetical protein
MMTAKIGSAATTKVIQRITSPTGLNSSLAELNEGKQPATLMDAAQIRAQNVAADLAERSSTVKYPAIQVYCGKMVNELKEKFRSFSGRLEMCIEVRHSQDRIEGLQDAVELYADAITRVLSEARGDWGDGMFYGGEYEVSFGPAKAGGRNFMQVVKVTFEIGVSRS